MDDGFVVDAWAHVNITDRMVMDAGDVSIVAKGVATLRVILVYFGAK
jgi:hypothetical protein